MLFCYKIILYISVRCHYAQKFRIVSTQDTKRSCRIESVLGIGFWSDPTWSVLSLHSFFSELGVVRRVGFLAACTWGQAQVYKNSTKARFSTLWEGSLVYDQASGNSRHRRLNSRDTTIAPPWLALAIAIESVLAQPWAQRTDVGPSKAANNDNIFLCYSVH